MSRVTKIKLSQVPSQYHNQMFANLVNLRGVEGSKQAIEEDITLSAAFPWMLTPEGHEFWQEISEDRAPTTKVTTNSTGETIESLAKEAEQRGFAIGVDTKFGLIRPGFDHSLDSDSSFWYSNIRVRKANGKWIKPLGKVSKIAKTTKVEDSEVAIHAFIEKLIKAIHSN
jgi:hypothetical protein